MNQFFNSENKIMSNKDNLQLFEMKKNYQNHSLNE